MVWVHRGYNEQGENYPGEYSLSINRLCRAALQRVHNDNSTITVSPKQVNTTMETRCRGEIMLLYSPPRLLYSEMDYQKYHF